MFQLKKTDFKFLFSYAPSKLLKHYHTNSGEGEGIQFRNLISIEQLNFYVPNINIIITEFPVLDNKQLFPLNECQ